MKENLPNLPSKEWKKETIEIERYQKIFTSFFEQNERKKERKKKVNNRIIRKEKDRSLSSSFRSRPESAVRDEKLAGFSRIWNAEQSRSPDSEAGLETSSCPIQSRVVVG